MNQFVSTYVIFIGLGIIMGIITEVRNKQYGWFSIRIVFMALMALLSNIIQYRHI